MVILHSIFFFTDIPDANAEEGAGETVYVIPIEKEVERGLQSFLQRTTTEAAEAGADQIIFEIDTPGGSVSAAGQIGSLIYELEIPTTAFVVNEALSAGSYIAMFSENIYFRPNARMGASGVINADGTAANKKAQSAWLEQMRTAAELHNRDPLYAAAMADSSIDLPEYDAPEGEFLTLGPQEAVEVGYAEGIVEDRTELLNELGLSEAEIVEAETTFAEDVARFLTNPVVIPILLSIASIGLVVELYSPGFGIAGTMGAGALILFFYGHIVAGLAGMEAIILLILGLVLLVVEIFAPGGIMGLIGIAAIIGSLLMSGYNLTQMSISIAIAFILSLAVAIFLLRRIGLDKGIFRRIILQDSTTTEKGYISSVDRKDLLEQEGNTLTALRPSGIAEFNGERLDVVSQGGYVDKGQLVKVIEVEGARIVVKEIQS